MSFVSGRRFPSRLRNQGAYEIKGGEQKKEQFCCEKREQKFSFCRERNSRRVSRPPLSCRLLDSYLTHSGNLAPQTKVVPL